MLLRTMEDIIPWYLSFRQFRNRRNNGRKVTRRAQRYWKRIEDIDA